MSLNLINPLTIVQSGSGGGGTNIVNGDEISLVQESSDTYSLHIDKIPYTTTAPSQAGTGNLFDIVVLPKSVEATTTKYNGHLYIFVEDPTP